MRFIANSHDFPIFLQGSKLAKSRRVYHTNYLALPYVLESVANLVNTDRVGKFDGKLLRTSGMRILGYQGGGTIVDHRRNRDISDSVKDQLAKRTSRIRMLTTRTEELNSYYAKGGVILIECELSGAFE